jgi:AraC family transcriptional regulator, regulatory protein of adaptative response / DNA-3-methyladenine glycosylase II
MSGSGESGAAARCSLRPMIGAESLPDQQTCEQARLSRDARFDGLFFTAVRSTGIYCRPVCPAPAPRPHQVAYYPSAAAAEAAGFRPCLRCRPELAPGEDSLRRGDALLARALALIDDGLLAEHPLAVLAARLAIGERQLRRLFVARLGAPPSGVHATRRLLFAKQLLSESTLPVTEVALAAGFGSLRRFNDSFRRAYRMAPSELRRRPRAPADGGVLRLRLGYRPPYDFAGLLEFLGSRCLAGVERVEGGAWLRLLGSAERPGWLRVAAAPDGAHALDLTLGNVAPAEMLGVVARVRRMFDLDADPQAIGAVLARDPLLAPIVARRPGLRLPGAWDGFEAAVRAVLGQQVSVAAARTLASRLLQRCGLPVTPPHPGLDRLFPSPAVLADAELDGLGLTGARIGALRGLSRAMASGEVDCAGGTTLEDFVRRWTGLPGIGPWTAHYVALRALSHPDALPAADLVLRRAAGAPGPPLATGELERRAEAWRPWRSYAVIHLWREAAMTAKEPT